MKIKPPLLVCRLTSGLGNQLFQLAAGTQLSMASGRGLVLDLSWFRFFQRHQPRREFRLDVIGLDASLPKLEGWRSLLIGFFCINHPAIRRLSPAISRYFGVEILREKKPYVYDRTLEYSVKSSSKAVVLNGYWQVSRYAAQCAQGFREQMLTHHQPSSGAREVLNLIKSRPSAFVHVRRGDYLQFGDSVLSPDYYRAAKGKIESAMGSRPAWFVFSEDLAWARENLAFFTDAHLVQYESQSPDWDDLYLMASCNAGIIANSSFSWWGATLGSPGRPICCPRYWWGHGNSDFPDLRPRDWMVVEEF